MNIANKIKKRRDELGLSQQELADRCGWGQSRISGYETGEKVPPLKSIKILEKALNVHSGYLTIDENDHNVSDILQVNQTSAIRKDIEIRQLVGKITTGKPVLKLQEAHDWTNTMEIAMQDITRNKVLVYPDNPADVSDDYIPILVENDSMLPDFRKGDVIIVEPHRQPNINDYVVARLHDANKNIFAQYFIQAEDNKMVFKFTNSDYAITVDIDKATVIGVVVESRRAWV